MKLVEAFQYLSPPVLLLTVTRLCFFCDFCFVDYVLCLSCFLVRSSQPCGRLLGKGLSLDYLAFDVFIVFLSHYHVVSWCPGSGVVLDCIYS